MSGLYRFFYNLSSDASEQPSLFKELWDFLTEKYFTLDITHFDNLDISLGSGGMINLSWAIIALCLGCVIAAVLGVYEKRGLGEFVRKLIYEDCYTPESAKTLYELGFHKNASVRSALRHGSLSKLVICTQKQEYDALVAQKRAEYEQNATESSPKFKSVPYKINFEKDTFYIPKDASYAADVRYDKKGSGIGAVLFAIAVALILTLFIIFILPDMLKLLDNFIGVMTPESNIR